MLRKVIYGAACLLVLGILAVLGAYFYFLTFRPDHAKYPVMGIDVSHHQNDIRWERLPEQNIRFAYIKSTEGGDWKDRLFQKNWSEADKTGIKRGAYHFYSFCRSGQEQAQNFISTVEKDPQALPPALDLEFGGNCKQKVSDGDLIKEIRTYLDLVEKHYQKRPVLYVTPEFYKDFSHFSLFRDYPLWARNILFQPAYTRDWTFWQFHNRARLDGIAGPVDLNVYKGSVEDFDAFLGKQFIPDSLLMKDNIN